jgi:hypothetical protein
MVRIRYIGDQMIARAFGHTFSGKCPKQRDGLKACQIAMLTSNPQLKVNVSPEGERSTGPAEGGNAE